MAIDYGKRRTGIAVSDPMQIIANGLDTVDTPRLLDFIRNYMAVEEVGLIVVGLPVNSNGTPSENAGRVKAFVGKLRQSVDVPVEFHDERFTSVLAQRAMIAGGLRKMERRNKAIVDKVSATIILQSFMESNKYRNNQIR